MDKEALTKCFLLRARNGREVIARIPTPIAGSPHYTTASEVAAMDFLRDVLKVPVPEVFAYSATSDNPVGAEYILMERVKDVMTQIADMERKIFDFQFPAYGSLYYNNDLDGESQIPVVEIFGIGPVSARQFWHGERSTTTVDRGPCMFPSLLTLFFSDRLTLLIAIIQYHAKPQSRQTFLLPTDYDIHPSEHGSLLSQFLQLASHLIRPGPSSAPTLRHPDLSLGNILLASGSTKIINIIDWQDAVIFPRLTQAGYPAFCEHDASRPQSLEVPSLPDHFSEMDIDEQRRCRAIFRLEEANLYYTAATGVHNSQHMDVLKLPRLGMLQYLLRQTGYPWDAGVINLHAALVGITTPSVWSKVSSAGCLVVFSDEEREAAIAESKEWNESEQLLSRVREHLDIDLEGGTEPDNFERAVEGNRQQAEAGQQEICWRNWPYKDKEDNSMHENEIHFQGVDTEILARLI
ncbi:uncharacterized protein BJX67DRAFT_375653 [Aspergillus lucknowensis]|uniref:Aminoglycoside phosphotransferase domain-containing protein n=1 Tax=Aspergillus lucknowensis TaxID=176173 RepID=A0ABR4L9B5_9EURO